MSESQTQFDFDALPQNEQPEFVEGATIQERFESFHSLNPHVYLAIVSMAREFRREGFKRVGMKMIFEQLRWKFFKRTRGDKWKFNNDYTAHYARLVMKNESDLEGFFETREQKSKQPIN